MPNNPSNDLMTVIIASLIPLLGGLSQKQQYSEPPSSDWSYKHLHFESPHSSPHSSTSQNLMTPKRSHHYVPLTPKCLHHGFSTSPLSTGISSPPYAIYSPLLVVMVPAPGFELCVCLHDFAEAEGVDMTKFKIPLSMEEYTPGRIPFAEDSDLCVITGAPGGHIVVLKVFCHKWQIQYKERSGLVHTPFTTPSNSTSCLLVYISTDMLKGHPYYVHTLLVYFIKECIFTVFDPSNCHVFHDCQPCLMN